MGYKIALLPSARKELADLDKAARRRIAAFIDRLETLDNPRISGIALQGPGRLWRYRVGDYRLIAEINDSTITIVILRIGNRREVYR